MASTTVHFFKKPDLGDLGRDDGSLACRESDLHTLYSKLKDNLLSQGVRVRVIEGVVAFMVNKVYTSTAQALAGCDVLQLLCRGVAGKQDKVLSIGVLVLACAHCADHADHAVTLGGVLCLSTLCALEGCAVEVLGSSLALDRLCDACKSNDALIQFAAAQAMSRVVAHTKVATSHPKMGYVAQALRNCVNEATSQAAMRHGLQGLRDVMRAGRVNSKGGALTQDCGWITSRDIPTMMRAATNHDPGMQVHGMEMLCVLSHTSARWCRYLVDNSVLLHIGGWLNTAHLAHYAAIMVHNLLQHEFVTEVMCCPDVMGALVRGAHMINATGVACMLCVCRVVDLRSAHTMDAMVSQGCIEPLVMAVATHEAGMGERALGALLAIVQRGAYLSQLKVPHTYLTRFHGAGGAAMLENVGKATSTPGARQKTEAIALCLAKSRPTRLAATAEGAI